jgi:hypothetical protein
MPEPWLGSRYFRRLSDLDLIAWRPADGRYHEGNISACNREVRRRAAKAGMGPLDWIAENR